MRVALIDGDNIPWVGAWLNRDKSDDELFSGIDAYINEIFINTRVDKYIGFLQHPTEDKRRGMFADYKANRPPTPDWLVNRKPIILDYLRLNWGFTYTQKGYESDDAIASVDHILQNEFSSSPNTGLETTVICSPDKDMKQIEGWNYNTRSKELTYVTYEAAIKSIYMQLLHGDTTDNIPNVQKGIGPAKAAKILEDISLGVRSKIDKTFEQFIIANETEAIALTKFAENVLKVVLIRDPEYKFELLDVPEKIKSLYTIKT